MYLLYKIYIKYKSIIIFNNNYGWLQIKNKILNIYRNLYKDNSDFKISRINSKVTIFYFSSLCSLESINNFVITSLIYENKVIGPNIIDIDKDKIDNYLYNGFVIILDNNKIKTMEVKSNLIRSISSPETQQAINGPKDSFNENIENNLGLIKRRIKSEKLFVRNYSLGKDTKTITNIIYIDNLVDKKVLNKVINIIEKKKKENILDASRLIKIITESSNEKNVMPKIYQSERPDDTSNALLEGKLVILVDNSPYALIMPSYILDFVNPYIDEYNNSNTINFVKLIRYICLFITLFIPAFYIAIINYNKESIPTNLLVNFIIQRDIVPFPSIVEAIIMLIVIEILKESDIRFPSKYGSAISILGALVLGEAAVSAGLATPIMIIVISLSYIASLIFTNQDFNNALRHYRFTIIILSSIFGLYGILLGFLYLVINISTTTSLGNDYTIPIAPIYRSYFRRYIWKK